MEVVLKSQSRRLNFHGQPGREVHLRCGDTSFLFRMTVRDLLFMHENGLENASREWAETAAGQAAATPVSPHITLRQGDTIRLGRELQFSRDGQIYHVGVEDTVGRLDVTRTRRLADPAIQALIGGDIHVSRNHVTIDVMAPDIVMVNDLGSTNGTHLNYIGL